jgi:hypothetical protein
MKSLTLLLSLIALNSFAQNLKGVWQGTENTQTTTLIATENYLTVNVYELEGKKFIESWGGRYEVGVTNEVFIEIEFHSNNPSIVNSSQSYNINVKKKNLDFAGKKYAKVGAQNDDALSGLWRITARANEKGDMTIMTPGPRKTLKIMSGGYFQWFAINTQTREFFGTGGGKYTLENKVYTENIKFFSRDSNRVGAVLSFEAEVKGKEWVHSGVSSKGDPIKEVWSKQ